MRRAWGQSCQWVNRAFCVSRCPTGARRLATRSPGPAPPDNSSSGVLGPLAWADPRRPVSLNQGTLALLLLGGVALGAHHEHLGLGGAHLGESAPHDPPSSSSKGFFAEKLSGMCVGGKLELFL